jgi:hypothetical protein
MHHKVINSRDIGRRRRGNAKIIKEHKILRKPLRNLTSCRIKRVCLLVPTEGRSQVKGGGKCKGGGKQCGGNLGELEHGRGDNAHCLFQTPISWGKIFPRT